MGARARRRMASSLLRVSGFVVLAMLTYLVVTGTQVWWASRPNEPVPADAVVVLGAAQYDGRPSPVLQARLDHAVALYDDDAAPQIWVTGYNQPGDRFTEAGAAARYLQEQGIPGGDIERITVGATTSYRTLVATARELRRDGIGDVVLVSDPYHSYRIADIAEDLGLQAQLSPAGGSPVSGRAGLRQLLRETLAVAVGRILGYGRLERIKPVLDDVGVPGA